MLFIHRRSIRRALSAALLAFAAQAAALEIVAFRGLHQSVRGDVPIENDTCTAQLVNRESHSYIENTLPSLQAAFDLGATIGHFNLHRTADGEAVVFHDASLECRTDGHGLTKKQTLGELKKLDVGYGYSWDGGKTFPLRGAGIGAIPTLKEVIDAFPGKRFVINEKDNELETIEAMARVLNQYPAEMQKRFYYLGERTEDVRRLIPGMQVLASKARIKTCLKWWLASGWTGYIHESCRNTTILMPVRYLKKSRWLAESLARFVNRAGSSLWAIDAESPEDVAYAREIGADAIGTYRIDRILSASPQGNRVR